MKYLFTFLALIMFLCTHKISAQQQHEIGIRLHSLNNYGVMYKKQQTKQQWTRLRLMFTDTDVLFFDGYNRIDFTVDVAYGWEKRKVINERLTFLHGFEPRLSFSLLLEGDPRVEHEQNSRNECRLSPALGYILGGQLRLKNQFFIYVEIIPAISSAFRFQKGNNAFFTSLSLNANSSNASIGFIYRFARDW